MSMVAFRLTLWLFSSGGQRYPSLHDIPSDDPIPRVFTPESKSAPAARLVPGRRTSSYLIMTSISRSLLHAMPLFAIGKIVQLQCRVALLFAER